MSITEGRTWEPLAGMPGWFFMDTSETDDWITLAARQQKTPSALPIVVAAGQSYQEALANLTKNALLWERTVG